MHDATRGIEHLLCHGEEAGMANRGPREHERNEEQQNSLESP